MNAGAKKKFKKTQNYLQIKNIVLYLRRYYVSLTF